MRDWVGGGNKPHCFGVILPFLEGHRPETKPIEPSTRLRGMFSASSEKNNENSDRGGYSATTPRCLARDSHVSAQSASSFRRVETYWDAVVGAEHTRNHLAER